MREVWGWGWVRGFEGWRGGGGEGWEGAVFDGRGVGGDRGDGEGGGVSGWCGEDVAETFSHGGGLRAGLQDVYG